jgi:hypothetical protein
LKEGFSAFLQRSISALRINVRAFDDFVNPHLKSDLESGFAGWTIQLTLPRFRSDAKRALASRTIDLDFDDLRNESEATRAGPTGEVDRTLVGSSDEDCVAVRTGHFLFDERFDGWPVTDPASSAADLADDLAQTRW